MGGFTIDEAGTVERKIRQAQSWLKNALKASKFDDPVRAVLKTAFACAREALRRFDENRDPEWIRDALKSGDFSGSPEAARCIETVKGLCEEVIDREARE